MALPEPVDIGSLGRIIRALQDNLKDSARQGADEQTALDSQFIGIGEEAGEALGAYRRWRGFARRAGTSQEVYDELADVLIVTMVGILHYAEVQGHILGTGDGTVIEEVLARKLNKIFSRGWINKGNALDMAEGLRQDQSADYRLPGPSGTKDGDPYPPDERTPKPDGVYLKTDRGWSLLGPADDPDTWTKVTPPYIVCLGKNLVRGE